ncbi:MAG TPA: hypothetical protein VFK97_02685 [Candidatus Saccharimonadales bacterium]|nr:hypothetical protein [Candidatus Saccharimonadales bacterium]
MPNHNEVEKTDHEINWVGRLDGGVEKPDHWQGKISARFSVIRERFGLSSDESARQKLGELKEKVGRFYVMAGLRAVVRCIDGRGEDGASPDITDLGPQVPGGTPVTSLAYRFSKGLTAEATIESDFVEYGNLLESLGLPYSPGAHEDEHNASHPENTGCGAIDKMLEILKIMQEYATDAEGNRTYRVYEYAKAIASTYMDEASFERVFQDIQVKLQALNGPHFHDHYFQKDEESGSHRFRSRIVEKVKDGGRRIGKKTVERLTGEHNEVFLIVNHVEGETFDRDGFADSNQGLAQAFNYDVWVVAQRARDIFPEDAEKQRTMLLTNIMYAVGTAMALTDGSLELGIRQ